jgi:hypothetical protein
MLLTNLHGRSILTVATIGTTAADQDGQTLAALVANFPNLVDLPRRAIVYTEKP